MSFSSWFSRSIGFPLILNGRWRRSKDRRRFLRLLNEKLASQYWPSERQQAQQLERLKQLLVHAGQHVPYYRDLFRGADFDPRLVRGLSDVAALPPLTRATVQAHGQRLLSDDAPSRGVYPALTGGSTGVPLRIWQDAEFGDHAEAGAWLSDMTAGRRMGSPTALLWGASDLRHSSPFKQRASNWLRNQQWYDADDLSENTLLRYHRAMQTEPPEILTAYATAVTVLANVLEAHGLKPSYPRVALIPTAEVLDDTMRATLQRVFPAPVFDRYGSSELGLLACECERHQGLHLNLADHYVECLGPDVYTQPGELLITHLNNYSMPLIRYQVDDLALMAREGCTCGRGAPLVRQIVGRAGVMIVSPSGAMMHAFYFTTQIRKVPGVREFQLAQESLRHLRVLVVPGPGFAPEGFDSFRAEVRRFLGDDGVLTVELVDRIPRAPSGKAPMMRSILPGGLRGEMARSH